MATNPQTRRALIDQIPTEEDRPAPAARPQSGIHSSELGRQAFNTAMALPGIGGIGRVAQTGGLVSRAVNTTAGVANKVATGTAALAALPAGAEVPEPAPTAQSASAAGAGRGTVNPPTVGASNPLLEAARQQDWSRQGMTNAQVAQANPEGRVQFERQPNGTASFSGSNVSGPVSYANGAGTPLAGAGIDGRDFGGFDSAPSGASVGIGAGGYGFETSAAQQASPVGMSVQEAQSKGLVGERVGYNPAYDQRINGVTQPALSNSLTVAAQGQTQAQEGKPKESLTDFANRMAAMEKGGGAGQRINAPTVAHSGNDAGARMRLADMKTSASSIMNSSRWGGRRANQNPSVMAFMLAQQADLAAQGKQPDMEMQATGLNAGLEREGMQQAGADRRDQRRSLIDAARLGQDGQRLSMERETQQIQNRPRSLIASLQEQIAAEQDPTRRDSLVQRMRDIEGKGADVDPYLVVPGGQQTNREGQVYTAPSSVFNRRSGAFLQQQGGQQQTTTPASGAVMGGYRFKGGDPADQKNWEAV